MKRLLRIPFFIRLLHWEYWSSSVVYAPLYPYYAWLSWRAGSFFFLTAANPSIRNGGFIMESKKDVYDLLPEGSYPRTWHFMPGTSINTVSSAVRDAGITYPLIVKPDIGERGLGVKKVDNQQQLHAYIATIPFAFLVQEYIAYEQEAGVFYYKDPDTGEGHISGIVSKYPVMVTGNGIATIAELVKREPRYILQWQQICELNAGKMDLVPAAGEAVVLVPYGNHSRGSLFKDESYRITGKLVDAIHRICSRINDFHYGRLDIRFDNWDDLEAGRNFSIIEVNGSGSEPTHIYDPGHSIVYAWKEIVRHWRILYRISRANNNKGVPYVSFLAARGEILAFKKIDAVLSSRVW